MAKSAENGKARAVWFGMVDVIILLILAGFICSMFLIDGKQSETNADPSEKLVFAVSVQSPYSESLFLQEGNGSAVPLRLSGSTILFGSLLRGDDGNFYVACDLSAVEASEDREGLWILGDTVLMTGSILLVDSELADFSVTVLTIPEKALIGTVGTTEEIPETSLDPDENAEEVTTAVAESDAEGTGEENPDSAQDSSFESVGETFDPQDTLGE